MSERLIADKPVGGKKTLVGPFALKFTDRNNATARHDSRTAQDVLRPAGVATTRVLAHGLNV